MGAAPIIIPLVALVIPIFLLLAVLVLDAVFVSWAMYRVWHDRVHGRTGQLLHPSP